MLYIQAAQPCRAVRIAFIVTLSEQAECLIVLSHLVENFSHTGISLSLSVLDGLAVVFGAPFHILLSESAGVVEQSQVAGADPAAVLYAFEVYLSGFVKMSLTLSRETGHLPCPFQTFFCSVTVIRFGVLEVDFHAVSIVTHGSDCGYAAGVSHTVPFPVIVPCLIVVLGYAGFAVEIQVSGFLAAVSAA